MQLRLDIELLHKLCNFPQPIKWRGEAVWAAQDHLVCLGYSLVTISILINQPYLCMQSYNYNYGIA